jgi:hypothetical protein
VSCVSPNMYKIQCRRKSWHVLTRRIVQQEETSLHQQTGLKCKELTSNVLHLEHSILWCCNVDTSESRSEMHGMFWNVVLERDGEDQLDRSCEK